MLAGCFVAVYGMVVWLVATGLILRSPAMGAGATIDLTVTLAAATWWLGSRRGHLPRGAPAVVIGLGLLAARLLLPDGARATATVLRFGWSGVELVLIALLVARSRQIGARRRALRLAGVPDVEALERALAPSVGALTARLLATELDALGHAFAGWRRATPREDERTFTMHRRSHHALIVGVLLFCVAGETIGLHLVLAHWSSVGAWIATLLSVWGALWIVGDMHAVRLRPLRLAADGLVIELGIRWRTFVPYDAIRSVAAAASPRRGPRTLAATVVGAADVHVTLSRPLEARGILGRSKRFDEILLSADRPEVLIAALRARI
jgi:membrane protein YdbS with pleckstrin-like domain